MTTLTFLYSTKKNLLPKIGLLLNDGSIAVIDQTRDPTDSKASQKALDVISGSIVTDIIWWWPSGNAFRDVMGISETGVIRMFESYGFTLDPNVSVCSKQVSEPDDDDDTSFLSGYIQLTLNVSEQHHSRIASLYGSLK
jgi:hypothetical protein